MSVLSHPRAILAAGCLILGLNLGVRQTLSLLIPDMVAATSLTLTGVGLAFAIQNLMWGLASPFAGILADRYGTGRVLAIGALLYSLSLIGCAWVSYNWQLHMLLGIVLGLGVGATTFGLVLGAVGRAFPPQKRAQALGLASAGGSLGQFLMAPLLDLLNRELGWQDAYIFLGLLCLTIIPAAYLLKGKAQLGVQAPSQSISQALRQAGQDRNYWLLNMGFFVCGFHVAFIATYLPAFVSLCGLPSQVSAQGLAMIGLANIVGTLGAGYLGSRYRPKNLLSLIYGLRALVILVFWLAPKTQATILLFSAAMGLLWLSTVPLTSGTVANLFGPTYMATLFGVVMLSHQIGGFFGAFLGGWVMELTGSFDLMWWLSIGLGLFAMFIHLPIKDQDRFSELAVAK
ncbi:MFS transporter [Balneatrix alpica]|uniref:MFS transporter n=1 Tax=Balneatrix alpica TaxID=75684 RepID=A0ABV5ZD39_9GAMM|nr:MFS transporter [Balneatrix alpica]